MIRQIKILEYALGGLARRRWRTLSLLAVYALTVAVVASVLLFAAALRAEATRLLAGAPEIVLQRIVGGRHAPVPESHTARVAALRGVSAVQARVWGYYYDPLTKANLTLLGAPPAAGALGALVGRLPREAGEVAVGSGVAAARRLATDHDLILVDAAGIGRSFTVTGVFAADSALLTNDLVLMEPGDLRGFFALPDGEATDLVVRVRNPREIETVAAKIKTLLPDTRPVTRSDLVRTYDAVFDWRSGMLLAALAPALAAFAILAWDRAAGLTGEERREVGVLKAVGWGTGDLLLLKLWEALVLSGLALAAGLLLAQAHLVLFDGALLTGMLRGWSVLYPPFALAPAPEPALLATLALLTVGPYVAATLVPAWKAAVTDPDSVLRG